MRFIDVIGTCTCLKIKLRIVLHWKITLYHYLLLGMIRWPSWTVLVGWCRFVPAASGPIGQANCAWAETSFVGSLWVTALWMDGAGDSLCTQSTRPPRRVTCYQTEHCSRDRPLTWSAVFWVSTILGRIWSVVLCDVSKTETKDKHTLRGHNIAKTKIIQCRVPYVAVHVDITDIVASIVA